MRPRTTLGLTLAAAAALTACIGTDEDRVLGITATGMVRGVAFLDANGNGALDGGDAAFPGAEVGLAAVGSSVAAVSTVADDDGAIVIRRVEVGTYQLVVDPAALGDSVEVVTRDPETFTLTPGDTADVAVGIAYPEVSVEAARTLAVGVKVFVVGVTLNGRSAFGDASVHLQGDSLAIRLVDVAAAIIFPGDSTRFRATTDTLNGQPVLRDAAAFLLAEVDAPVPDTVDAATAAAAGGGALDAALVALDGVTVSDTATVSDGFQLTVDDASGSALVLLEDDGPITDPAQYIPGTVLEVVGVLVPDGAGAWIVKPRSDDDLTIQ